MTDQTLPPDLKKKFSRYAELESREITPFVALEWLWRTILEMATKFDRDKASDEFERLRIQDCCSEEDFISPGYNAHETILDFAKGIHDRIAAHYAAKIKELHALNKDLLATNAELCQESYELRRLHGEQGIEIERLKDGYAPQEVTQDLLKFLRPFDKGPGNPNTLWALTKQVTDELTVARREIQNLKMVCRRLAAAKTLEIRDRIAKRCVSLFRGSILRQRLSEGGKNA